MSQRTRLGLVMALACLGASLVAGLAPAPAALGAEQAPAQAVAAETPALAPEAVVGNLLDYYRGSTTLAGYRGPNPGELMVVPGDTSLIWQ